MLSKHGIKPDSEPIKSELTISQITNLIKLLTEAHRTIQYSPIEALPLEIAISEFYNNTHV